MARTAYISVSMNHIPTVECGFSDAQYKLYSLSNGNSRIVTTGDDVKVWKNNANGLLGSVNRNGVIETSNVKGDVFYSCSPIFGSGRSASGDRILIPDYVKAPTVSTTASRYGGIGIRVFSINATQARIYRNGVFEGNLALTAGQVSTFNKTGSYTGSWRVEANGDIIADKGEDGDGSGDTSPMLPASNKMLGWGSSSAYVGKESSSATSEPFTAHSVLGNYTGNIATTYNIVNSSDLPHSSTQSRYYDPNCAMAVIGSGGIQLHGNSRADSDGGNETPFMSETLMRRYHKIPQPSEFVSIINLDGQPIRVKDSGGNLITTITPTKTNTNPNAPYSTRYGSANGASNIPRGTEFESDSPLMLIYQPKGAGGGFGSDDDETISFGYNL